MEDFKERIKNNYKRLASIGIVIVLIVSFIVFVQIRGGFIGDPDVQPSPTPLSTTTEDIGFYNDSSIEKPSSYVFEDPIKTPETVTVYPILPGPNEIFSSDGIVSIATQLGFTSGAEVSPTQNGYFYFQQDKKLTVQPSSSMMSFSNTYSTMQPITESPITGEEAKTRAQAFVSSVGFANPLINWNEAILTTFEITDNGPLPSAGITNKGYYEFSIPMQIRGVPIIFPNKLFVQVYADGKIIGAQLWYPNLEIATAKEIEIISFLDAVDRIEKGDGIYAGDLDSIPNDSITFSKSGLAYVVPNQYVHRVGIDHILTPIYIFSMENTQLYVSALAE